MSVARACRRFRIKIKSDPRYNRQTKRDAAARDRRNRAKWQAEKDRQMRGSK